MVPLNEVQLSTFRRKFGMVFQMSALFDSMDVFDNVAFPLRENRKLSRAEIRTTHVTGIVTDIGIELGKLFYWNRHKDDLGPAVMADRDRLRLLSSLAGSFFIGGLAGALGFKHVGYLSTVPLALMLVALALVPALDDLRATLRGDVR